jgi:hypothetical protein
MAGAKGLTVCRAGQRRGAVNLIALLRSKRCARRLESSGPNLKRMQCRKTLTSGSALRGSGSAWLLSPSATSCSSARTGRRERGPAHPLQTRIDQQKTLSYLLAVTAAMSLVVDGIGILFGFVAARLAATRSPIDALRCE